MFQKPCVPAIQHLNFLWMSSKKTLDVVESVQFFSEKKRIISLPGLHIYRFELHLPESIKQNKNYKLFYVPSSRVQHTANISAMHFFGVLGLLCILCYKGFQLYNVSKVIKYLQESAL